MSLYIDQSASSSTLPLDDLRQLWWRQTALGHRLPAEPGVILIDGGADTGATATEPPDSGPRLFGSIATGIIRDLELQRAATAT